MAGLLKLGPVCLATVIQARGSVPREVGAKMIVAPDGHISGTIGGGAGEAKVIRQARQQFEHREKQIVTIDLSGLPQRETQGVCGGRMDVWLDIWDGEASLTLVHQILAVLQAQQAGLLVTPLDERRSPFLHQNGGDLQNQLSLDLASLSSPVLHIEQNLRLFLEPLLPPPALLLVGAGHVGVPLAAIAHLAGFRVIVQDDRPEFACPERFPMAAVVTTQPIADLLDTIDTSQLYVALVTRGYLHDITALQALISRSLRYIGMIGSEKRVQTVYQLLRQQAESLDPTNLQQIHAPIGLDIGALTPEEIAVSICAELIKVRRGGTGLPLSAVRRTQLPITVTQSTPETTVFHAE